MSEADRIKAAIEVAIQYGGIDGDHHKAWVIDQMLRQLTGCPKVQRTALDCRNESYTYEALGESQEYTDLIAAACDGEDGPETYGWDAGIPP